MSFPKTGKFLRGEDEVSFAAMVSTVLRGAPGERPASVKQVARWTGAGERTVKNWFSGTCAPRGHHFRSLVQHCPEMLEAFLASVGRRDRIAFARVEEARERLREALAVLDSMTPDDKSNS
ncbi:hypothetical protein [Methylobacterium sp. J-076]|uniref:hypothetical protein n=1 Tax=Methylobacterium sp. J-076 TaxID=2836655 RepID=UPI001FBB3A9D|nr:hypothetical protein [Methylobacterium sp. J-076]MCJ2013136.1 hypothetical protein [Methylobacterium sp. J-076]